MSFDSKAFLASLTPRPGVYRMLGEGGRILYVGKAGNLRRRVASYFRTRAASARIHALMTQTVDMEVTVTRTEQEALLLESTLIKTHRPRFNVVLRDDKSYPWIHVTTQQPFPRFEFHRGARRGPGEYLGPWPNAGAVRETLVQVQRLFRVRQCTDTFYASRSRPCLQHQIGRCTAPCVGLITEAEYRRDVNDAMLFLQGRNEPVVASLGRRMEEASGRLDFESAARLRDQISAVRRIQAEQVVEGTGNIDADVLGVAVGPTDACVTLLLVRNGRVLGTRQWFPDVGLDSPPEEISTAFIGQHYLENPPPAEILVRSAPEGVDILEVALRQSSGTDVRIRHRVRGTRRRWLELAETNAAQGLATRIAAGESLAAQWRALAMALTLGELPERIECFDISHTAGGETVASCVVFGPSGAIKSDYRRFNIGAVTGGDDYAAIAQAVSRRYSRVQSGEGRLPDLILIDGGAGQVASARTVLESLALDQLPLVGVAKGRARRPGDEQLVLSGSRTSLRLGRDSPALLLIQRIRDEAHRFALTGHRQRRGRQRLVSELSEIPGLGPARRRALLRQFGGLAGVRGAGIADLAKVDGISVKLAERIYDRLHGRAPHSIE